jgi:hypothetical protein
MKTTMEENKRSKYLQKLYNNFSVHVRSTLHTRWHSSRYKVFEKKNFTVCLNSVSCYREDDDDFILATKILSTLTEQNSRTIIMILSRKYNIYNNAFYYYATSESVYIPHMKVLST